MVPILANPPPETWYFGLFPPRDFWFGVLVLLVVALVFMVAYRKHKEQAERDRPVWPPSRPTIHHLRCRTRRTFRGTRRG